MAESKKPVRNPLFQSVQISATPKTNRTRDAISRPQNKLYERPTSPALEAIPPSSLPRIPQSVAREGTVTRNPLFSAIQETPTRALPRTKDFLGVDRNPTPMFPPSSPLHIRRSSAQLFARVPASAAKLPEDSGISLGVLETPVKKKSAVDPVHGHSFQSPRFDQENKDVEVPNPAIKKTQKTSIDQQDSIYKSLGWEDDDIDDLR
jgi:DNA replication regulator SLD3